MCESFTSFWLKFYNKIFFFFEVKQLTKIWLYIIISKGGYYWSGRKNTIFKMSFIWISQAVLITKSDEIKFVFCLKVYYNNKLHLVNLVIVWQIKYKFLSHWICKFKLTISVSTLLSLDTTSFILTLAYNPWTFPDAWLWKLYFNYDQNMWKASMV